MALQMQPPHIAEFRLFDRVQAPLTRAEFMEIVAARREMDCDKLVPPCRRSWFN
jgi:hypothetical protein